MNREENISGITLVEVVVGMALLLLTMAVFISSFTQARRSAAIADNNFEATHAARNRMETILALHYNATNLNAGTHSQSNWYYTVSNNASANVKDIVVVMKWVNPGGQVTSMVSLAGSMSSELHP